nr:MAG TPA: hypothetical protein [Caudoviricetes sp.]
MAKSDPPAAFRENLDTLTAGRGTPFTHGGEKFQKKFHAA